MTPQGFAGTVIGGKPVVPKSEKLLQNKAELRHAHQSLGPKQEDIPQHSSITHKWDWLWG